MLIYKVFPCVCASPYTILLLDYISHISTFYTFKDTRTQFWFILLCNVCLASAMDLASFYGKAGHGKVHCYQLHFSQNYYFICRSILTEASMFPLTTSQYHYPYPYTEPLYRISLQTMDRSVVNPQASKMVRNYPKQTILLTQLFILRS